MPDINADFILTIASIAGFAALGSFSYWWQGRPHDKLSPRMVPWRLIAMGCLATVFMLCVHLINLLGFETGR